MREIKFRFWDGKKMWLEDYLHADFFHGILACEGDTIPLEWTGLKDKNGKEIYEGDIVHETWWAFGDKSKGLAKGINRVVEWEVVDESGENDSYQPGFVGFDGFPSSHFYEVIGNVWENKELLK